MQIIHNPKHLYLKTKSTFADHELGSVGSVQTIHTVCPKHAILAKEKEENRHLLLLLKYKAIMEICANWKKAAIVNIKDVSKKMMVNFCYTW